MNPQELLVELEGDCTSVARGVARNFDGVVDWEDVRQELFVYVLTNGKGLDPENRGGCRVILGRVAQTFCQKERAKALHLTPQYHYTLDRAKYLLLQYFAQSDDFKSTDDAGIENDQLGHIDELLDLKYGLQAISRADFDRIWEVGHDGVQHEKNSAGRRAYYRALEKLLRKMNSYFYQRQKDYEGPGNRTAMTAGQARDQITSTYDGYETHSGRLS